MKKMIVSLITSVLIFSGLTANALTITKLTQMQIVGPAIIQPEVSITSYSASTNTIYPDNNETVTIKYCINATAKVIVGIYKAKQVNSSDIVNILSDSTVSSGGCYSHAWNGKYGSGSPLGNVGDIVSEGDYFYGITANANGMLSKGTSYKSDWITVKRDNQSGLKFTDVSVENSIFDPYNDQESEITFVINKSANITLIIKDEDGEKIRTLADNKYYDQGEYTINWDGEDSHGDKVSQGEYTYKITAAKDNSIVNKTGTIEVKRGHEIDTTTVDPRLKTVYATKEIFDPGRKEKTNIVFTLTTSADVMVTIYDKNSNKIETLLDKDNLSAKTYSVEWDGQKALNKEGIYTYRIYTQNSKGEDKAEGKIEVKKDSTANLKPDVYKDKATPMPYQPKKGDMEIYFLLDKQADVTVEIRDGGNVLATIVDEQELAEGPHAINWDGKDQYGEYLEDGIYQYKIIAGNNKGKDVETANFSIENAGNAQNPNGSCGEFYDVDSGNKYCEAIKWTSVQGIFEGYNNGDFKPNQTINRAEALKVVLIAMKVRILNSETAGLNFSDVNRTEWYAPYLKTALAIGVVNGYGDGTFRPGRQVSRSEALVMLLNTTKAKYGLVIPTNTYGNPYYDTPNSPDTRWYISYVWFAKENSLTSDTNYFYPSTAMTRAEMADMLYRLHVAGYDRQS